MNDQPPYGCSEVRDYHCITSAFEMGTFVISGSLQEGQRAELEVAY
jgi:hypothetical protein